MKPSFYPFGRPTLSIKEIGDVTTNTIYLQSKGYIPVSENPISLQELLVQQEQLDVYRSIAIDACAAHFEVDREAATIKFEGKPAQMTQLDGVEVETAPEIKPTEKIERWLNEHDRDRYLTLKYASIQQRYPVATLYLQRRYVWAVEIAAESAPSPSQAVVQVKALKWDVPIGALIRIKDAIGVCLEVAEFGAADSTQLVVKRIPAPIADGSLGLLLDVDNREKIGIPDWTEAHTRELLSEAQVGAIQSFYLKEAGYASDELVDRAPTDPDPKQLPAADPDSSRSTGSIAISASNPTDAATNGQALPTLERLPVN